MDVQQKRQYLDLAKQIALEAGGIMKSYFGKEHTIQDKEDGTPVTIADTTINHMVIERIVAEYPDHVVVGEEESTGELGMGLRWLCDPIDGTKSFTWGVPITTFVLVLLLDGRPVVAVIYNPFTDELFSAIEGGGAFVNDERIHVNNNSFDNAFLTSDSITKFPWQPKDNFKQLVEKQGAVMILPYSGGCYKYCQVASGRLAGYINIGTETHDVAAGDLLLTEAGGKVTDIEGGDIAYLQSGQSISAIGSNGTIHETLLGIVRSRRSSDS